MKYFTRTINSTKATVKTFKLEGTEVQDLTSEVKQLDGTATAADFQAAFAKEGYFVQATDLQPVVEIRRMTVDAFIEHSELVPAKAPKAE